MRRAPRGGLLVLLLAASTSCGESSAVGTSESPCPAPTDRAPQRGECTLVDWDATSVTDASVELTYFVNDPGCSLALDRVEVDETSSDVTVRVVVGYAGDEGAACPTEYAPRTTTVALSAPLGDRRLLGCRPEGSFVPAGGYNAPAPRDAAIDCTPEP